MPILNKYKRWNNLLLLDESENYDIVLSQDNTFSIANDGKTERCLIADIDFTNPLCISGNHIQSLKEYIWPDAIADGISLNNIGLVGVDNGLIKYNPNTITNQQFFNILTTKEPDGYPLEIEYGDARLKLTQITGNTNSYDYRIDYNPEGFYELKGGFFQGFWKIFGENYQVLPQYIDKAMHCEFVIRPKDYEISDKTLNSTHENGNGIFFYIGTRAENKFASFYNKVKQAYDICEKKNAYGGEGYFIENEYEDYLVDELCLSGLTIETSDGDKVEESKSGKYKIQTDNKYLFFNRTKTGLTVDEWNQCDEVELVGKNKTAKATIIPNDCENKAIVTDNKNLFMNRTKTGYTVDTLDKLYDMEWDRYDEYKDLFNNAFALRIDENGHIGYQYLIKDCNGINGFNVVSEYSDLFTFEKDKWYTINVRFQILNGHLDKCDKPVGERKMKIYIYINGYLKFISQELPEFNFKELDDYKEKQETVPFNISIGGGSQGLGDSVWLKYKEVFAPNKTIENYFAGSFIGDFKSFRIYNCPLEYAEIKNNAKANNTIYE